MISKREISKIIKKVIRRQKGLRDHQIIHPRREWAVGLIAAVLFLVGGAVWSLSTYNVVSERDISSVNTEEIKQNEYQENLVEAALGEFRSRKEGYESLLGSAVSASPVVESVPEVTEDNSAEIESEESLLAEDDPADTAEEPEIEEVDEDSPSEADDEPTGAPGAPPDVESGA